MTAFNDAISHVMAQARFYFRETPWQCKEALGELQAILEVPHTSDSLLYDQIVSYCTKLPKTLRYLHSLIQNTLTVYQHSIHAIDLTTYAILEASDTVMHWRSRLPHCRGRILAIGFNAESRLHVIVTQQNNTAPRTVYLRDLFHRFSAAVPLHYQISNNNSLLSERRKLSNYEQLANHPRQTLIEMIENSDKVVSIVEPDTCCPEGEVLLKNTIGEIDTINLQGNTLFLGESGSFFHDEEITFYLETGPHTQMKHIPIRIWHKPWQMLLNSILKTGKEKKREKRKTKKLMPTILPNEAKQKIIIALHGIFDHKGAYHEVAKTILADSAPSDPIIVIAADWPTYGSSTDRDQPMPTYITMKHYLMALLEHIAAAYPDSECYLIGESLGASMIFICRDEIKAFQARYACIKGIIAVSPAIHDPSTNLYFQRRFLGYSTASSVFRSIWFHDPEVNHQNATCRILATIPYLSEAYRGMQQWPDDIPCAVLLASNDSVVTKAPFLKLYQSHPADNMVFYAFPSRHLLLRSRSEGRKYLSRHVIHYDIGEIVKMMSHSRFTRLTILPVTGARSAVTIAWFRQVYQSIYSSSSLSDWPCTSSFYPMQSSGQYEATESPIPLATTLLGVLPDKIHAIDFIEHAISGDGDCGFHVLGITRLQLVSHMLPLQDNIAARTTLASEIRAALLSDDLPDHIKPIAWRTIKQTHQGAWDNLEHTMTTVKAHVNVPYPEALDLRGRVAWLRKQTTDVNEKEMLKKAITTFKKSNRSIDLLCQSTEAFVTYINLYQIPKMLWLGYQTALLWAKVSHVSLTIWRKHADAANKLTVIHAYHAPEERSTIHMLHTAGFTHFNLLKQVKLRNLSLEKAQILSWNQTDKNWPLDHTLYKLCATQARKTPQAQAVISARKTLSYTDVFTRSNRIAHALKASGAKPNRLVAILMHKGWEQIVACLGVLGSGAAFLPMDASWPETRLKQVLAQGKVKLVLTQRSVLAALSGSDVLSGMTCFPVDNNDIWNDYPATAVHNKQKPEDIAYVIFTSGSTGQPKGVVISHQNAINTLFDINQRFHVKTHDRVLALSNLSFDLAIYDVFGLLSVGGALVLPEADQLKEPSHWLSLITTHHVTLWNTVPMFMQMLVEFLDHVPKTEIPILAQTLRLTLLSGDWIPLTLPPRIKHYFPNTQLVSLGGATEGSVWSILYPIDTIDPQWKSIPYGTPMGNQHMYVLNDDLTDCPFDKVGEIYIGGKGVALGYWRDKARSAASFILHPTTGERLYKTGDLGQWSPAGYIEFIGRKDTQVKISGHRIELGEIESTLTQHPTVDQSVVVPHQQKQLIAYVVPNRTQVANLEKHEEHDQDWREIYESIYQIGGEAADPTFNISGWRSSYTGELIPDVEMLEWVNLTVNRILMLKPKRVLEIGCGTGLLVARVAPHCESYIATDISASAIAIIGTLKERQSDLSHVTTFQRPANDFSGWETLEVDTIVINSVVQCFSSVEYLLDVIEHAIQLLRPCGQLFIGDVRHLGLLEAYHASVQLYKTSSPLSKEELLSTIQSRVALEEELLIDPSFFHALRHRIPRLRHTQVQMKSGKYHNELNRFRYDAVLHISDELVPMAIPKWRTWERDLGLSNLREQLLSWRNSLDTTTTHIVGIKAIPNARLSTEAITLQWMHTTTKAEFNSTDSLKIYPIDGIDPHAILQLGESLGLRVELRWHYENPVQFFDALFIYETASLTTYPAIACNDACCDITTWQQYVNYPLLTKLQRDLVPTLTNYLSSRLPHYMLPNTFFILPQLPLSSNGKVDRLALPAPTRSTFHPVVPSGAHTATEKVLITLFCEALSISNINITDSFFSLGGNSLLAVHLIMRINQQFKMNLPVSILFTHQCIKSFAKILRTQEKAAAYRPILTINAEGKRPPLFFVHSGRGGAEAYVTLASHFNQDQPIHVIESYNLCNEPPFLESIEAMARQYLRFMRSVQPEGPYYLGGWSQGGLIAYEMAQILKKKQGQEIRVIYFLDTFLYSSFECRQFRLGIDGFMQNDPFYKQLPQPYRDHVKAVDRVQTLAMLDYKPIPYDGQVVLLKASDKWSFLNTPEFHWSWITRKFMHHAFTKQHNGWSKLITNLTLRAVPGHHQSIMDGDNARVMAHIIQADVLGRQERTLITDIYADTPLTLFGKKTTPTTITIVKNSPHAGIRALGCTLESNLT